MFQLRTIIGQMGPTTLNEITSRFDVSFVPDPGAVVKVIKLAWYVTWNHERIQHSTASDMVTGGVCWERSSAMQSTREKLL